MAYRITEGGFDVHRNPEIMYARLVSDFAARRTLEEVAQQYGVERTTIWRWCKRLAKIKGLGDPRHAKTRPKPGGLPRLDPDEAMRVA